MDHCRLRTDLRDMDEFVVVQAYRALGDSLLRRHFAMFADRRVTWHAQSQCKQRRLAAVSSPRAVRLDAFAGKSYGDTNTDYAFGLPVRKCRGAPAASPQFEKRARPACRFQPSICLEEPSVKIAIVGGGFSGLMSAFLLEKLLGPDTDIVILERTGRLGGRIQTCEFDGSGGYYDSGAAELYEIGGGYSLKAIARALGLKTRDMVATPIFHFAGRLLKCHDDFQSAMGNPGMNALKRFWDLGTSLRTPDQYAQAGHPADNFHPWFRQSFSETLGLMGHAEARRFTEIQAHSDVATEPDLTTGLFGFDNLLIDHPDYAQMFTLVGGNERLIEALAERVSARVLLNAPVSHISGLRGGSHEIVYDGESSGRLRADFVLLTPPPFSLNSIRWSPNPLDAAIRQHVRHHLHPADYVRVTIRSRERTWEDELPEDYFVCEGLGGVTVYDKSICTESRTVPILSLLVAGAHASDLAQRQDSEVLRITLDALPPSAGVDSHSVEKFWVDRWTRALGVSRLPGGVPLLALARRHCPCADYPDIFALGDYLYDTTINGALDACVFVAKRIFEKVTGKSAECLAEYMGYDGFLQTAHLNGNRSRRAGQVLPFVTRT